MKLYETSSGQTVLGLQIPRSVVSKPSRAEIIELGCRTLEGNQHLLSAFAQERRQIVSQGTSLNKKRASGTKGERLDNLLQFLETHPISKETLDHFGAIPWTQKYLTDSAYRAIPTYGRVRKSDSSEDYLFAQTMNTSTTIPHFLTLQRKDLSPPPESPRGKISLSAGPRTTPYRAPEHPDCITLLDLGSAALGGHYGMLHGGIARAILDETLGLTASLHLAPRSQRGLLGFTTSLNVTYRAPVFTPSCSHLTGSTRGAQVDMQGADCGCGWRFKDRGGGFDAP